MDNYLPYILTKIIKLELVNSCLTSFQWEWKGSTGIFPDDRFSFSYMENCLIVSDRTILYESDGTTNAHIVTVSFRYLLSVWIKDWEYFLK